MRSWRFDSWHPSGESDMKRTRVTERFSVSRKGATGPAYAACSRGQRRADGVGDAGRRACGGAAGRNGGAAPARGNHRYRALPRGAAAGDPDRDHRDQRAKNWRCGHSRVASDVATRCRTRSFRPAQAAFGNTMTAFIRGIGQYDFDFAFEPGVAIYIDDMYHPFTLGSQIAPARPRSRRSAARTAGHAVRARLDRRRHPLCQQEASR